jgi:nucleotide-binding universal stress UspA family protein
MEIRTVLCPVDFSGQTARELALATQICTRFGARLVLEHNLDPRPPNYLTVTWMWSEEFEGAEEQKVGKAQKRLQSLLDELAGKVSCEAKLTRGPIDDVLVLLAKELPADLIVMGSHGWSTAEHTSLTEKMIGRSPVPVLTVGNREGEPAPLFDAMPGGRPRLLATVDDESKVDAAVEYAVALAREVAGNLLLLEIFPEGSAAGRKAGRLAAAEEQLRHLAGDLPDDRIESKAVAGHQVESILDEIAGSQVDLVVRPVHGGLMPKAKRRQQADFGLLHSSPCPVLFVPAGFSAASS